MTKRYALDTETTGITPGADEILTLSIVAEGGAVVWDALYKPSRKTAWPYAQRVNGISPEDVADCPAIEDDVAELNRILSECDELLIFNAPFDLAFLDAVGIKVGYDVEVIDTMLEFAEAYGEPDRRHRGEWRWQKLGFAADHIGYVWGDDCAHSSVGDCRATLAVQAAVDNGIVEPY